jgi:hypothetical protein
VLTARTRRTVGVDTDVVRFDFDFDIVVHNRVNPNGRERGVTTRSGIVGRNANQTVHARF